SPGGPNRGGGPRAWAARRGGWEGPPGARRIRRFRTWRQRPRRRAAFDLASARCRRPTFRGLATAARGFARRRGGGVTASGTAAPLRARKRPTQPSTNLTAVRLTARAPGGTPRVTVAPAPT